MDFISWGIQLIKDLISSAGYIGILILMALESACLPIPSEIVMPFAGWLAYDGVFSLTGVIIAGTIGCVLGSITAYAIGMYGGRAFIVKYGKYVLLSEKNIQASERWFQKYGDLAIFASRLLPVVRTFISLPAGIARMDFKKFVILTFLGCLPWCAVLAVVGYYLGENYDTIRNYFVWFEALVIIGLALVIAWYLVRRRKKQLSS
jgi:membrane protein DedA with SNARE-associated domain